VPSTSPVRVISKGELVETPALRVTSITTVPEAVPEAPAVGRRIKGESGNGTILGRWESSGLGSCSDQETGQCQDEGGWEMLHSIYGVSGYLAAHVPPWRQYFVHSGSPRSYLSTRLDLSPNRGA
jgi:hypothetical protein